MDSKQLDIRTYSIPKNGKIKQYDKMRSEGRIVFYYFEFSKTHAIDKCWFNKFGGGCKTFILNELGIEILKKQKSRYFSIPEANFKLIIEK